MRNGISIQEKQKMKITFTTKNIDKKLYSKGILNYIYEHYNHKDYARLMLQDKWEIIVSPVSESIPDFYLESERTFLSNRIPHGVTGDKEINVYVLDIDNSMIMLQNFSAIYHEVAHMILKIYYPNLQVQQRTNDFYGKKGQFRKMFSSEVHDRSVEGKFRQIRFFKNYHTKITLIALDILDLTNSRKVFSIK